MGEVGGRSWGRKEVHHGYSSMYKGHGADDDGVRGSFCTSCTGSLKLLETGGTATQSRCILVTGGARRTSHEEETDADSRRSQEDEP